MKSLIKNIILGMFCGLMLLPTACTNLDEFDSSKLADPVVLSVVVAQVKDSAVQITATNPSDGYITLGLMEDPGEELEIDPEAFFTQNYEGITFKTVKAKKNVALQVDFDELVQYTDYVVYAVSSNADGVIGEVVNLSFSTSDSHGPLLMATSPEVSTDPAMPLTGKLVLEFDEPVKYDSTKLLEYYFYNDDVTVQNLGLNVTVEDNIVTITSDSLPRNREIVFVSWAEGAFSDLSDNPVEAMTSGIDDDGYPSGLYFRTVLKNFVPTIVPIDGDTVSVAEIASIVLTFTEKVSGFQSAYTSGGTLSFEDEDGSVVTKVLKRADFSISGKTVTLTAPQAAVSGQTVTLKLKATTFKVGLSNPNAAVEASWLVE